MSVQKTIETRYTEALKAKNTEAVAVFRMLRAAIKNEEIERRGTPLTEEDVVTVVSREIKKLKDALLDFEKAGRDDLVQKTKKEIALVKEFMPEQLNEDELKKIIQDKIATLKVTNPSEFGRIMGEVMKEVKSRADGKLVTELVKQALSSSKDI